MSAYILSICGAVILSALVTIIMPEGKIGKFINGVLKILCVFIMLVPLVNWVSDLKFEGKGEGNETEVSLDEDYLDYFFGKQAESFSEELKKIVEKEFSIKVLIRNRLGMRGLCVFGAKSSNKYKRFRNERK